jgi:hypothetical protein
MSILTPITPIPNRTRAFPTKPSPEVSNRYMNLDSNLIIDLMANEGYSVHEVKWNRTRTIAGEYSKHMIDFRRPSDAKIDNEVSPRILFMNSNDGSTRARFLSGLIRYVCSNGLIVGSILSDYQAKHIGEETTYLLGYARSIINNTSKVFDQVEKMRSLSLSQSEILNFSLNVLKLRFNESSLDYDPIVFAAPRRLADTKRDLWTIFNRLQENAIKGGIPATKGKQGGTAISRSISNIERDLELNTKIWSLASDYTQ